MESHYLNSSFREKLIEHLFIGEFLKLSWKKGDCALEVSRPEVDAAGYDLVMEAAGVARHIQLKASYRGSGTSLQKIHSALSQKPSGCVIWIYFDEQTLDLGPFLFFGSSPGEPLPDLSKMKIARHTKGNAQGFKAERPNIRVLNKGAFTKYESIYELWDVLFVAA